MSESILERFGRLCSQMASDGRCMQPLANVKVKVSSRVSRDAMTPLVALARSQGMKPGPFLAHVAESVSKCPAEKFHAAMAEFLRESAKR